MLYALVKNNSVTGSPFTLPTNYITDDGRTITNVENLTVDEKIIEGIYPVTELNKPSIEGYQVLEPTYTINALGVDVSYTVVDVVTAFPQLVEQRLTAFAKQKDIDIQEVAILLNSSNPVWQQEAQTFQSLYDATWQAFYASTATTWLEVEVQLPVLAW